jgi:tetratricopeptide (TPR) repeat protein
MSDSEFIYKDLSIAIELIRMGKYKKAYEISSVLFSKRPTDPYIIFMLAKCEYLNHNTSKSKELLSDLIASGHPVMGTYGLMGSCYLNEKDFKNSERCFLEELSRFPKDETTRVMYAYLLFRMGRIDEGLDTINKLLEENPFSSDALKVASFGYSKMSDYKNMKESVSAYMDSDASHYEKLLFIANFELCCKNWDEAEKLYIRLLDLDPENKDIIARIEMVRKSRHPVKSFLKDLRVSIVANFIMKSQKQKKSFSFTVSGKHIFITRKSFVELSLLTMNFIAITSASFNKDFMAVLDSRARLQCYLAITLLFTYIAFNIMGVVLYNSTKYNALV